MKVLVTGATGFIGNHLVRLLVRRGLDIVASSRNGEKARRFSWHGKVKYIPADLGRNNIDFYNLFGDPTHLIHLAWDRLNNYRDKAHLTEILPTQYEFLKKMIEGGLKSLAVTGTCLEYGLKEGCLSEEMETRPVIPYARAKDELRRRLARLVQDKSIQFKWIRLFYTYGPGQHEKSILSQLENAVDSGRTEFNMSWGKQKRDYLPVEKMAERIAAIAFQEEQTGVFNCASGEPVELLDFVKGFLKRKKAKIKLTLGRYPYPEYEPMEFWGDISRLNKIMSGSG